MKKDTPIQILQLSKRSYNVLEKFNIITVQDLLTVSIEDIKNFKGIGKKSIQEILSKIELLKDYNFDNIDISIEDLGLSEEEKISKESVDFLKKVAKILDCNTERLISNISDHYFSFMQHTDLTEKNEYNYITENIVSLLWWKNSYGKEKWLKYIIRQISKNIYGIEEDVLWESIPEILKDKKIYKKTIEYLCESNLIKKLYDDRFVIVYKSVKEEVYNYLTENEANIFLYYSPFKKRISILII